MTRKISVIGLPFFARRTAAALRSAGYDARYVPRPGNSPRRWWRVLSTILTSDLVYAIGSSVSRTSPLHLVSLTGKPIVLHWVGTDVQVALGVHQEGRTSRRLVERATHWADAPWLVQELRMIGIDASELLLPVPAAIGSPMPLPERFTALIYLPRDFQISYDAEATMEVVKALPEISFMVAGGYRPPQALTNLEILGFVEDMPAVYARSTALLRLTHHDGMSHSVIEALSFGRHVLWSYPLSGAIRVSTAEEAITVIRELAARFAEGDLAVNAEGAARVTEKYHPAKILEEVRRGIDSLLL